jgi:hypothetical protein
VDVPSNQGVEKQINHPTRPARFRGTRVVDPGERKTRAIGTAIRWFEVGCVQGFCETQRFKYSESQILGEGEEEERI